MNKWPIWTNISNSVLAGLDAWNVKCVPWEHNKVGSAQLAPDCGRKGAAIVPWDFSDLWSCTVHLFCVYEAPEHAFHLPTITSVQLLQDALIGLFWQWILLSCFLLLSLGCKWRHGFRSHICYELLILWSITVTCSVVLTCEKWKKGTWIQNLDSVVFTVIQKPYFTITVTWIQFCPYTAYRWKEKKGTWMTES